MSACEQLTGIVGTEHLGTSNNVGKDHRALPGAAGSEAATVPFPLVPFSTVGDYRGAVRLHLSSNLTLLGFTYG